MAITGFATENRTYRQLMGNGVAYHVPKFQRDYSWSEENWEELWSDIEELHSSPIRSGHYMGYLVISSEDNRNFEIIDGQQRLATLSILVLAALANLKKLIDADIDKNNNNQRLEELRSAYISYVDLETLTRVSKLKLNRNNNRFYQTYLVPLQAAPKRNRHPSEHLLRKAFEWFEKRLEAKMGSSQDKGVGIIKYLDSIADGLFFTVITVNDELNAYKVFETLNARGVRLSSTDLLKNYLYSVVDSRDPHYLKIEELDFLWDEIVGKLGEDEFTTFLRVSWNSRHSLTRKAELYKEIKKHTANEEQVFGLLRQLDLDADIYSVLGKPEDKSWNPECRKELKTLSVLGIRQPFSLLIVAKEILNDNDFARLLRACVVISIRFNTIMGLNPNEQEAVYNRVAVRVSRKELAQVGEIIRALKQIYPDDESFQNAFAKRAFDDKSRGTKIVKYLLLEIEQHLNSSRVAFDSEDNRCNIEHILPQNPDETWTAFDENDLTEFRNRLGNMTLLDASQNKEMGNKAFEGKRSAYEQSPFEITKGIADYDEWTPETINKRQQWLAKHAKAHWRLSEMD